MRPIGEGVGRVRCGTGELCISCKHGKAKKVGYDKTCPGGDKVLRLRRYGIEGRAQGHGSPRSLLQILSREGHQCVEG